MASSPPLHHLTRCFISGDHVSLSKYVWVSGIFLLFFVSVFLYHFLCDLGFSSGFLKGFCNGWWSPRHDHSWMRGSGHGFRPIKAAMGMPPFPIFEPPQVESDTPSEVWAMPISSFVFLLTAILYSAWFLRNLGGNDKWIWSSLSRVFLFRWRNLELLLLFPSHSNRTDGGSLLCLSWNFCFSIRFLLLLFFIFLRLSAVAASGPRFLQDRVCSKCSSIRCWIQRRAWWIWSVCL